MNTEQRDTSCPSCPDHIEETKAIEKLIGKSHWSDYEYGTVLKDGVLRPATFEEWQLSHKRAAASHLNQSEPNKADPKHIPTSFSEWLEQNNDSIDIGGNFVSDRIEANEDRYEPPDGEDYRDQE